MTGRALRFAMLLALASGALGATAEAAVQVTARVDRPSVRVGEQAVLTVEVEGDSRDIEAPQLPAMPDFQVVSGGQSQRFSFVNGQVSANYSFTYYLRPRREGDFELGPIQVRVDGHSYAAVPVALKVLAGNAPLPESERREAESEDGDADMFVTMTVDEDSVVVGEQIILTFGFYRAVRLSPFDSPQYTPPSTEGFWLEDLPPDRQYTTVIQSRRYSVQEVRYALFPTHSGELTVGEAVVRVPEDVFGSLLRSRRGRTTGPRLLRAEPIPIHVRPLPPGAPEGFRGAVGARMELSASVDRRELSAGEALTLTVRLEGDGYLASMRSPELPDSDLYRVHDAGGGSDSRPIGGRLHGVNTVQKLIVPRQAGTLELPGLEYPYYDTERGEYVTLRTEPIALRVAPSEGAGTDIYASGRKAEIELLSRDILHIRPVPDGASPYSGPLPSHPGFWAALALPALVWIGSGQMARRRERLMSDPARLRSRRARSRAEKVLAGEGAVEQRVATAVRGYVADKLDRAASGLTEAELRRELPARGVDASSVDALLRLLSRCDAARYAPGSTPAAEWLREARVSIDALEKGWNDAR